MKINVNYVDENFIPSYAMTMVVGRIFQKDEIRDRDGGDPERDGSPEDRLAGPRRET